MKVSPLKPIFLGNGSQRYKMLSINTDAGRVVTAIQQAGKEVAGLPLHACYKSIPRGWKPDDNRLRVSKKNYGELPIRRAVG